MTEPRSWTIELAYPELPLSLNDRKHYMVKAREIKNLRNLVRFEARHQGIPRLDAIHVQMHWTPKTKRRRDVDNAIATLKPAIDGLRDYPARNRIVNGQRVCVEAAHVGVVADDDPVHVTWSPPIIHPADPDWRLTRRLVLVITERSAE